jgi:RNA polymerase sigma-70 factor (ECF subfamily)
VFAEEVPGMEPERANRLLAAWRQGDQAAAAELFASYAGRLVALARGRLSARFAGRIDPEDVVQSACRSFFDAARRGRVEVQPEGDLWPLLVAITLNKLHLQVQRNARQKRDVQREQGFGTEDSLFGIHPDALAREPSPVDAAALADEVEQVARLLTPRQRSIFEMRLQGYEHEEIAAQAGCSRWTVLRALERARELLQQRRSEIAPPRSPREHP